MKLRLTAALLVLGVLTACGSGSNSNSASPVRVAVGEHVVLRHTLGGDSVTLFDAADVDADIVDSLPNGTRCLVRQGPSYVDGGAIKLWRVFCSETDTLGWVNDKWVTSAP